MTDARPNIPHVVLIDGTFASLDPGHRSSIARIYSALSGWWGVLPQRVRVRYMPGLQWEKWRTLPDLMRGRELENRIRSSYGWLARTWVPGDPILLFGYSRGAFAVRSLAGMIGQVGLIRSEFLSGRIIRQAWDYYCNGASPENLATFRARFCHDATPIRMVGVFDTVVALGVRLPLLWRLTEPRFSFHEQQLGAHVELGAQALALDETRAVFHPILWSAGTTQDPRLRQVWFRGCHADIGGQLTGAEYARPLANIPLVWMLEQAQEAGLPLPPQWREHLPCDASAPSVGSWRYWGKAFLLRRPRIAGLQPSESLHGSVPLPYPGPAILTGELAGFAAPKPRRRPHGPRRPLPKKTPAAAVSARYDMPDNPADAAPEDPVADDGSSSLSSR